MPKDSYLSIYFREIMDSYKNIRHLSFLLNQNQYFKENPDNFILNFFKYYTYNPGFYNQNNILSSYFVDLLSKNNYLYDNLMKEKNDNNFTLLIFLRYYSIINRDEEHLIVLNEKKFFNEFSLEQYISLLKKFKLKLQKPFMEYFITSNDIIKIKDEFFQFIQKNNQNLKNHEDNLFFTQNLFEKKEFNREILDFIIDKNNNVDYTIQLFYINHLLDIDFIKKNKDLFNNFLIDDLKFITKYFSKNILEIIAQDNINYLLITSCLSVKKFQELINNNTEKFIIEESDNFKLKFPNLYHDLYTNNKHIMKSKDTKCKSYLEKIIFKQEFNSIKTNLKQKRI